MRNSFTPLVKHNYESKDQRILVVPFINFEMFRHLVEHVFD